MGSVNEQFITSIRIENLFDLYTYRLPVEGQLPNAAILYGYNGAGKSTILRLVFHLLSPADDRGHRSALFNTQFTKLEVDLASGVRLRARRTDKQGNGPLELSVIRNGEMLANWIYVPDHRQSTWFDEISDDFTFSAAGIVKRTKGKVRETAPKGEVAYLSAIQEHVPTLFMLNADRRLDSDSLPKPSEDFDLHNAIRHSNQMRVKDLIGKSREVALAQALGFAASWVRNKALQGANQGSMNVHGVYVDVLHRLNTPTTSIAGADPTSNANALIAKLDSIESRTKQFARYEFSTPLSTSEFKAALRTRGTSIRRLAAELLEPYIKSLEGRLDAVDAIYRLVDRFVNLINGLLSDKAISFKLSKGFEIQNRLGQSLQPGQLSSGEQQLLLLFSFVLGGREKPSVFIIDEPEISLNIKWQRQLVQSLLDITADTNI